MNESKSRHFLANDSKTRNFLALVVVCGYVMTIVVLALVPPLLKIGDPTIISEWMKTFGSLFSGTVGVVMGFYFGRSTAVREEQSGDVGKPD